MMFYKKHIMLIIYILSILYSIFLCFSIGLVYSSLTMNIINQLLALDLSLLQSARGWVWSEYAPIVQLTGEGIVVFWALFLVTLWLYGVFKKDNQYKIQALTIFLTVVSVFAIYAIINLGIPPWRPGAMSIPGAIAPLIPHPIDNSFPSGHALFSWAFLVALFRFFFSMLYIDRICIDYCRYYPCITCYRWSALSRWYPGGIDYRKHLSISVATLYRYS